MGTLQAADTRSGTLRRADPTFHLWKIYTTNAGNSMNLDNCLCDIRATNPCTASDVAFDALISAVGSEKAIEVDVNLNARGNF